MDSRDTLDFKYYYLFDDGNKITVDIQLDRKTLKYIPNQKIEALEWTNLENRQCSNCPLSKQDYPQCPLALNISPIVAQFSAQQSFDKATIMIETEERTYTKYTSIQQGLSSMLGILMVTTDCPVMSSLKPMVRFHLPFASLEETIYRSASTYLLRQYFNFKNGFDADWHMEHLTANYKKIQNVNIGMANRLRSAVEKDANLNALVVLDVFAKQLPSSIDESLAALEYLFEEEGPVSLL